MDNSLFDRLKQAIPLESYLAAEAQSQIKPVGDGTKRVNPCFACGHNDCLTLYSDNTFHCFSCTITGDVINAEQIIHGHESPGDAAKRLAEKYNIDANASKQPSRPSNPEKKTNSIAPESNQAKAFEIRRMAAGFYHAQLLSNPKGLEYLTSERKHSLEILKGCQVGYASGDLIAYAKSQGYTVEDLMGAGLAKSWSKGVRLVIPQGAYVFPHFGDGEVLFFTFKDPAGKFKHQLNKEFKDPGHICLGQDVLQDEGPVVIVEGENDFLSVVDKGKWPWVIATNGNSNTTALLKHIKENRQGRTFYLCFDNDQAGEGYTRKFADAIHAADGQAFKLEIPSPHKDIDEYLCAIPNPKESLHGLVESAKRIESQPPSLDVQDDLLSSFSSFEVLGETKEGKIVLWSQSSGKIYDVTLRDLNYEKMLQIGGEEVMMRVAPRQPEDKIHYNYFKRQIILKARKNQIQNLKLLGQGIHYLSDGSILLVNGSEIRLWTDEKLRPLDYPIIDNKIIDMQQNGQWVDLKRMERTLSNMNPSLGDQIVTRLANLFNQWGFVQNMDYVFLTGWIFSQYVQQVWEWRPHMWVTGPQGSGKTRLIQFINALGGGLSLRHEGQKLTEAGFRQSLGNDSGLCLIDEFEYSQAREGLIETLRSAGRGGAIHKGNPNGIVSKFQCRHMVLLASIEMSLPRAADNSRFLTVCTQKDPSRNPQIPSPKELNELRADVTAFVLWAALKAKTMVTNIGRYKGVDNRMVESMAVPCSMLAAADSNPEGRMKSLLEHFLSEWKDREDEKPMEDEEALLESILTARISLMQGYRDQDNNLRSGHEYRTVSQILCGKDYPMKEDTLASYGLKSCKEGVFLHPNTVAGQLLKGTKWEKLNLLPILKRLPGVELKFRDIGNKRFRGLLIPWNLLGLEQGSEL